jgi:hypothetical protein
VAASYHGDTPYSGNSVTSVPATPYTTSVDVNGYELAGAAFEDVLKVLRHSRNALERSPSLTAKLLEEEIPFILLVSLNAVFEGLAGGEVFNHKGKTDMTGKRPGVGTSHGALSYRGPSAVNNQ